MIKMMNNLFMNKDAAFLFLPWLALEFSVSQKNQGFFPALRKAEDVNVSCSFSTSEHFKQKHSSIMTSLIPAFIQRQLLKGRLMANLIKDVNVLVYGPVSESLCSPLTSPHHR